VLHISGFLHSPSEHPPEKVGNMMTLVLRNSLSLTMQTSVWLQHVFAPTLNVPSYGDAGGDDEKCCFEDRS
jgi:hypothetical protein